MTVVRRQEFLELSRHSSIDVSNVADLPAPVREAITSSGISSADLASIAGSDHIIRGEAEFGQLYDKLVELEARRGGTGSGATALDRAAELYRALGGRTDGAPSGGDDDGAAGSGRRTATGIGASRRSFVVEQRAARVSRTAPTASEIRVQREALALRTFENLRAGGLLPDVPNLGTALPPDLAERARTDFPTEIRSRTPTYHDLFVALAKDHDGNGTIDVRVDDLRSYGLLGTPPAVTDEEATALLLGAAGRGVVARDGAPGGAFVGADARGTGLVDGAARPTTLGRSVQTFGVNSSLGVVPSADAAPDHGSDPAGRPELTRAALLVRQGDTGRATLLREIEADPSQMVLLAELARGTDRALATEASRMLATLSVGPNAALREAATQLLDETPGLAGSALAKTQTIDAIEASQPTLQTRATDARAAVERMTASIYGTRGHPGMRATLDGASRIPRTSRDLVRQADAIRTLLRDDEARIRRVETMLAELDASPTASSQTALRASLAAELSTLRARRVELLGTAADLALQLERAAWGLADDSGWTRASYATGDRRSALDAAGRLLADVRTATLAEIDAQTLGATPDQGAIDGMRARVSRLERGIVDNQAHVRTFAAELRAALGTDAYRLRVLEATRDTVALVMAHFPSDPAVAKRAQQGDADAQATLASDRAEELRQLGLDPDHLAPELQGKTTLEIITILARTGDPIARARLSAAQQQLAQALDASIGLLEGARATPAQLEAMRTLRSIVLAYDFNSDTLTSFDLAQLEAQFATQLEAAGLHGITPRAEIDRMREIHDQTREFTLLTDLSAGVLEPGDELDRTELQARRLAADRAMRDPDHLYAVMRERQGGTVVFRVRQLPLDDAATYRSLAEARGRSIDAGSASPTDLGPVYVVRRNGLSLDETDRYSTYGTLPDARAAFRPMAEGGLDPARPLTQAVQSDLYATMYARASVAVADRYRTALHALDLYGVQSREDEHWRENRALFMARFPAVVEQLRRTQLDPPTVHIEGRGDVPRGLVELENICMLLGENRADAQRYAQALWNGETHFYSANPMGGEPAHLSITMELYNSGMAARSRYESRLADVTRAYAGTPDNPGAGREQLFDLYGEFPDLATEFYRQSGFTALEGFPPRLRAGAQLSSAAERQFLADASAWQSDRERSGYLKMGGLIAVGILITVASAGTLGPEVAAGIGIVYAGATSGYEVMQASDALRRANDARTVGAGSDATVRYRENELTGAWGALVINVATAGLAAKFGGGQLAGEAARLTVRQVVREAVVGVLIGSGAGALTAAVNPNTYSSGNTFGVILKGAVVGGIGGGAGAQGGGARGGRGAPRSRRSAGASPSRSRARRRPRASASGPRSRSRSKVPRTRSAGASPRSTKAAARW